MHEHGESDRPVVPAKSANKSFRDFVQELAERTEGRGLAKENAEPANRADGTQSPVGEGAAAEAAAVNLEGPQAALDRIRQAGEPFARHHPRQEPGAVIPPAGIRAGGGGQPPSLPRRAPAKAGKV